MFQRRCGSETHGFLSKQEKAKQHLPQRNHRMASSSWTTEWLLLLEQHNNRMKKPNNRMKKPNNRTRRRGPTSFLEFFWFFYGASWAGFFKKSNTRVLREWLFWGFSRRAFWKTHIVFLKQENKLTTNKVLFNQKTVCFRKEDQDSIQEDQVLFNQKKKKTRRRTRRRRRPLTTLLVVSC